MGTCPVGSFPKGDAPGGIHDLAGNVWEWTASHYAPFGKDRWTLGAGCEGYTDGSGDPVIRGGAWGHDQPQLVTTEEHAYFRPETRMDSIGFRCAL
jgi:formylglycine-generating enzyme